MRNKSKLTLIMFIIAIIVTCSISVIVIRVSEFKEYTQSEVNKISEYLYKKYGETFDLLKYSTKDGFSANYSFKCNKELNFRVAYWVNFDEYSDDLIQQCLTYEIQQTISSMLIRHGIYDFQIHVSSMIGPPRDLTKQLYEYYEELGRIPNYNELKNNERFSYVRIEISDDDEMAKVNDALIDLNLPTENLEVTLATDRE